MSWFPERPRRSWLQRMMAAVLKSGPLPRHVAIIMDGNRRYALKNSMERAEGHIRGFDKLSETLDWCLDLGITEVTVYAFSIENFKRSKDEVDGLMELARQKFARILEEKEMINKHGICIRVLGDIHLLAPDIQKTLSEAVEITKHNNKAILNVCFAYTARDDMTTAMREISDGVKRGLIRDSDISLELLESCLYTNKSQPLDLLIRTSGEVRLSDFMLWQSSFGVLAFVQVLWPEFRIWHLYGVVLHYQRNYKALQEARKTRAIQQEQLLHDSDYQCAMQEWKAKGAGDGGPNLQSRVRQYTSERQVRINTFLQLLDQKRDALFHKLANQAEVPCAS